MKNVIFIYSFLQFYAITSVISKGIGSSVCNIWGGLQSTCNRPDVPVNSLPHECSSIIYDGVSIGKDFSITDSFEKKKAAGFLDSLSTGNSEVIIVYTRESQTEWNDALKNDLQKEIDSMKAFFGKHTGITGLAFGKMEITGDSKDDKDYSNNVKCYFDLVRKNFPNMSLGLYVYATDIIYIEGTEQYNWLDYKFIESSIDFITNYPAINQEIYDCSDKYRFGPEFPDEYTKLVKKFFIDDHKIAKEKLIYGFQGSVTNSLLELCDLTYSVMCTSTQKVEGGYCASTLQKYYEMGKYANANGGGFMNILIDTDDVNGDCKCDQKYPIHNALFKGFTGGPAPNNCSLLDTKRC